MIISETLPRTDRPQRSSIRTRILTSDRNRQNRPRKWRYPSLGRSGNDLTTKDCSLGSFSTAERINKLEKILALVNSPHNGEAMSAARMLMKLSKAWRIDLGLFRDPSGQKVETLVDGVVSSNSGHYFSPHVREYPDPGTRPRTIPTFVKAHSRRRHGGPPFPVRPHRRRRRTRLSSSAQTYPRETVSNSCFSP